ncbi:helix-turn-helix domain-containing protein [Streptomyces armeniacus]|uniref:helix-turn-helix domain-containing protein n=1 Tax=Streptomyces armeniacus TaxID=83291 RepID=UPI001AD7FA44|nr:cupin domain-containing protein [Streptomyces armeniacus]
MDAVRGARYLDARRTSQDGARDRTGVRDMTATEKRDRDVAVAEKAAKAAQAAFETGETAAAAGPPGDDDLGRHIRDARVQRGLTLEALAKATGLSRSYLSNVEHNKNSPTISTLRTILDALGVTLSQLFRTVEGERHAVTRPDQRVVIARTGNDAVRYELLNPNPHGRLESMIMEVAPGASSGGHPHTHAGEEVGLILSGELDYWVDGVHYALREGDAVSFDATLPHRYANPGNVPSVSVWTVTPPSF